MVCLFWYSMGSSYFCIDRSLVITLKKDPTLKHQKFWVPLLSRSALACIIAFMVSIPLELVIFEDFIAEKKFFFNEDSANTLSKSSRAYKEENALNSEIMLSTQVMARLDSIGKDLNNTIDYLDNQISVERSRLDKPTTQSFVNAKNNTITIVLNYLEPAGIFSIQQTNKIQIGIL